VRFITTAPQTITILANDVENLESDAFNAGVSQELTSTLGLHVDVVYNRMRKIPLSVNINPRSGLTTGNRPLNQFARIDQFQSIGEMDYKAFMARLEKRFDQRYLFLVSYTLAKGEGNVASSGITSRVTHAENPALDFGPVVSDRRHALVSSGSVLLPWDVTLGAVWSLRSTMPFSALAGADLNGDAVVDDYVPGTTRAMGNRDNAAMLEAVNAYRAARSLPAIPESQIDQNDYNSFDLRVSKAIPFGGNRRVELIGQVFNLFGRDNLLAAWTTNALSNSFGRVLQASNRQQGEVALRVQW
jgi:hypothetical protein